MQIKFDRNANVFSRVFFFYLYIYIFFLCQISRSSQPELIDTVCVLGHHVRPPISRPILFVVVVSRVHENAVSILSVESRISRPASVYVCVTAATAPEFRAPAVIPRVSCARSSTGTHKRRVPVTRKWPPPPLIRNTSPFGIYGHAELKRITRSAKPKTGVYMYIHVSVFSVSFPRSVIRYFGGAPFPDSIVEVAAAARISPRVSSIGTAAATARRYNPGNPVGSYNAYNHVLRTRVRARIIPSPRARARVRRHFCIECRPQRENRPGLIGRRFSTTTRSLNFQLYFIFLNSCV